MVPTSPWYEDSLAFPVFNSDKMLGGFNECIGNWNCNESGSWLPRLIVFCSVGLCRVQGPIESYEGTTRDMDDKKGNDDKDGVDDAKVRFRRVRDADHS